MSKRILIAALLAAVAAPAGAQTVTSTGGVNTLTGTAGGVRYRELATDPSQQEHFLGKSDLGIGGNRVGQNFTWVQNGANTFTFTYDGASTLTSKVNGNSVLNYTNFSAFGPGATPFNQLSFLINDSAVGAGSISLTNLMLDGALVGTGTFNGVDASSRWWAITGSNFANGFSLTGTINLSGTFGGTAEGNRLEFLVGNNSAIPEPATWAMMIGGFGLVGAAMRRRERTTFVTA